MACAASCLHVRHACHQPSRQAGMYVHPCTEHPLTSITAYQTVTSLAVTHWSLRCAGQQAVLGGRHFQHHIQYTIHQQQLIP